MFRKALLFLFTPLLLSWLCSALLNRYTGIRNFETTGALSFFAILTTLGYLAYILAKDAGNFTAILLACVVVRLLCCMGFVLYLSFSAGPGRFAAAMHFLVYFVIFTIFDLVFVFSLIKQRNKHT